MGRGRKPRPTALRELEGYFKKNPDRRNTLEPEAPSTRPDCPEHLTGKAADEWELMCDILAELNILSSVDATALAIYCQTYSEYLKAAEMCERYGAWQVTQGKDGEVMTKRHEWDRVRERNAEACRKWLMEFGLTPSSRSRVQANKTFTQITKIKPRERKPSDN